jgi:hypothetical protein
MDNDFIDRIRKLVDEQGAQQSTASSGVDEKFFTAWRTVKAFKTNKGAKALA